MRRTRSTCRSPVSDFPPFAVGLVVGNQKSARLNTVHFTVNTVLAKYSVRFPLCTISSRLPQAMM
ncbi:MAG: hypothetical protein QOJ64_4039 [Acidobacteriota bacterium]|nr:hypothetical protein [Acidobacteriota bacterium]